MARSAGTCLIRRASLAGAAAASLALVAAAPAFAGSLAACDAPTLERATDALVAQGYVRPAAASDLTDAQADGAAWTLMAAYLDVEGRRADRGGETVGTLLALQRAAVPGLFRKVDSDEARFRLLVRDDDVVAIGETRQPDGRIQRSCRLALGASSPDAPGLPAHDARGHPDAPAGGLFASVTILPRN